MGKSVVAFSGELDMGIAAEGFEADKQIQLIVASGYTHLPAICSAVRFLISRRPLRQKPSAEDESI
jgi:hypothetical protein